MGILVERIFNYGIHIFKYYNRRVHIYGINRSSSRRSNVDKALFFYYAYSASSHSRFLTRVVYHISVVTGEQFGKQLHQYGLSQIAD